MSNPLAITAVTAAFGQLLTKAITESGVAGAKVRLEPPDPNFSLSDPLLNLFLYQVNPHGPMRSEDAPFRNHRGELTRPSVLPLNLHYLLTAYGKGGTTATGGNQLEAQHLLAHAMSFVNDNAMLTRDHIREAVNAYSSGSQPPYARLSAADLDGQVELVKLTPMPLTPEEISKLWSALNQSYRLSVAYEASVVLVSRPRPSRFVPPVQTVGIHAVPIRRPRIDSISPQVAALGTTLTIRGANFTARDEVRLRFPPDDVAAANVIPPGSVIRDDEFRVELTRVHTQLAQRLRAGPVSVRVLHQLRMGLPPAPEQQPPLHRGFESNVAVFVLAPTITATAVIQPTAPPTPRTLRVTVDIPVGRLQSVALIFGSALVEEVVRPAPPASVPDSSVNVVFPIPTSRFPAGTYKTQIRVDGAESAPVDVTL
jgi:hypothetical protein